MASVNQQVDQRVAEAAEEVAALGEAPPAARPVVLASGADRLIVGLWAIHLIGAVVVGVIFALLMPLGWWWLLITPGAGCALAASWTLASERAVRGALGTRDARLASAESDPRLVNVVEGVCLSVGIESPAIWVSPETAANAAAVGRDPDRSSVVLTQGLLDGLDRIALEAVVARLLTGIRDGRTASLTAAASIIGWPALLWGSLWPLVAGPMARATGASNDFDDDAAAVELTRYPPGLALALDAMARTGVRVEAAAATWPLWLADPRSADANAPASLPEGRADLETRVAVLREL